MPRIALSILLPPATLQLGLVIVLLTPTFSSPCHADAKPDAKADAKAAPKADLRSEAKADLQSDAKAHVSAAARAQARKLFNQARIEAQHLETMTQGLQHLNQAIQLDDTNREYYYTRAAAYSRIEEDQAALNDINRAIALDPNQGYDRELKAKILVTLKRPQEALDEINRAIKLIPSAPIRATRASILYALNRLPEAKQEYDKLVEENKDDNVARMKRVIVNQKLNCWEPVVEDQTYLIKIDDKNTFSYKLHFVERGRAYTKLKQYDKAEQDLKQAIKLMPDRRESHKALMDLYLATGRTKEAQVEKDFLKKLDDDLQPF